MTKTTNKIIKKIKAKEALIKADLTEVQFLDNPSKFIAIVNVGLANCINTELVIEEISRYSTQLVDFILLPKKSYCFLEFSNGNEAEKVLDSLNGIANLGQNGTPIFMSFCENIPRLNSQPWNEELPPGLIVIENIVSEEIEHKLLGLLEWTNDENSGNALKNRKVQHFGYEFIYGANNVDPKCPLTNKPIPAVCEEIWISMREKHPKFASFRPDQLTVNRYEPGHGIPSHCDTHSCFEDPIVSLSLGSSISMELRQPKTGQHVNVFLPQRSLLIMSGESRYGWTHGITPKRSDIVKRPGEHLTVQKRDVRTSFTFRMLKLPSAFCCCEFPYLCDVADKKEENSDEKFTAISDRIASKLEIENVHKVYDEIGGHFSETRHSPWPNVENFIQNLKDDAILLDVGCGNGKYLGINEKIMKFGCDRSESLLQVCHERKFNIFKCDCLQIPFRDSSVDACISIAVIHHLATPERRAKAIKEMLRVLMPGGTALIYVWAKDQQKDNKKSSYLLQHQRKTVDKIHPETAKCKIDENEIELPVHKNRTQFHHTNVLVPWKLKDKEIAEENQKVFLRYYHVFEDNELQELCKTDNNVEIVKYYYDQGNHCVIIRKIS